MENAREKRKFSLFMLYLPLRMLNLNTVYHIIYQPDERLKVFPYQNYSVHDEMDRRVYNNSTIFCLESLPIKHR